MSTQTTTLKPVHTPLDDELDSAMGMRLERMSVLIEHLVQMSVEEDVNASPVKINAAIMFLDQECADARKDLQYLASRKTAA